MIELYKSRDHTERMLTSLGAPVESDETRVSLSPVDTIAPVESQCPAIRRQRHT